jgi:hypothetical protein
MPTTFLFWNLARKALVEPLSQLSREISADVVLLAECPDDPNFDELLLSSLSHAMQRRFYRIGMNPGRVRFYSSIDPKFWTDEFDGPLAHVSGRSISFREGDVMLVGVHLPSKAYWKDGDQAFNCGEVGRDIRSAEKRLGHERTLVMGDFNMDPFEPGMIAASGFHSVMTRQLTERTVQGSRYPVFYNPMWGRLGDQTAGPPGTFFFSKASGKPVAYFWHTFDQMLLRPTLFPQFEDEFGALDGVGDMSLLSDSGQPDTLSFSDHLPVYVRLQLHVEE